MNNGGNSNNNNISIANNNYGLSDKDFSTESQPSEQPDPDYIKMFVGQVPKTMDENQLREMFEEFGRVHSINVLRDKVTGVSKGKTFCVSILPTIYPHNLAIGEQELRG